MVKSAEKINAVFVDCDWGRAYTTLTGRYGIRGYPSLVFIDSEGELLAKMTDRSPEAVKKLIEDASSKSTPKSLFLPSWEKALVLAKKEKKPILYLFSLENEASKRLESMLLDSTVREVRGKFVMVKSEIRKDSPDALRFKVENSSVPIVLVLDPREATPEDRQYRLPPDAKTPKPIREWLERVAEKLSE